MIKTVTKNLIYNLFYQVIVLLTPLLTVPYLSRVLGAEALGIYSYTTTISAYFVVFGTLGINSYAQREIAFYSDNEYERSKTFKEVMILRFIMVFLSLIFYCFVLAGSKYSFYFKLLCLEIIGNMFNVNFFYQGMEEIKKMVKINLIFKLLNVISIFVFVKKPSDLFKYILIYCFTILFENFSLWMMMRKHITKVFLNNLEIVKCLKKSSIIFISEIVVQVYFLIDNTLLGFLSCDIREVAYYVQSKKLINIFFVVITALKLVVSPRISKLYMANDNKRIKEYIYKCFNFIFLYSLPIIVLLFLISSRFVPFFFGNEYQPMIDLVYICAPILFLAGFADVIGAGYLLATKKEKKYIYSILYGLFSFLILSFILIPKYNSMGASIANLLSKVVILVIQFYYIRREFSIKKIFGNSKKYLVSAFIMFSLLIIFGNGIGDDLLYIVFVVIFGGIIYMTMLLFFKDDFILKIKNLKFNN